MSEQLTVRDLDLQIRVRSSKMSVQDLAKITTILVETLKDRCNLNLVDQNTNLNQNSERKLVTITTTFQSEKD